MPLPLFTRVTVLPPMVTTGVPMSSDSMSPPSLKVMVVSASTALPSVMSNLASEPSLTLPGLDTSRVGTSAPGPWLSTMAALPVSVMPAGRSTPLAVLPLSVASRVSFSLPSKTASSWVGTVTTMPPVVPAGTWKL